MGEESIPGLYVVIVCWIVIANALSQVLRERGRIQPVKCTTLAVDKTISLLVNQGSLMPTWEPIAFPTSRTLHNHLHHSCLYLISSYSHGSSICVPQQRTHQPRQCARLLVPGATAKCKWFLKIAFTRFYTKLPNLGVHLQCLTSVI